MSITITKITNFGLETINMEAKRFHILGVGKKELKIEKLRKRCEKRIRKLKKKGFILVPFEEVFDYCDWYEMYDKNGHLVQRDMMKIEDDYTPVFVKNA